MKDARWIVEFTTHVLANSVGPSGDKDCFQRDSNDRLIFNQAWFYSAFTRAIGLAHIRGIKPGDINMDLAIKADTQLYKRRYGDNLYRTHEAILPGTRVTFEAVVADRVTESNLKSILDRMGKFVGLSPYGYRLGFGKFNVIDVHVASSGEQDEQDAREDSQPKPETKEASGQG